MRYLQLSIYVFYILHFVITTHGQISPKHFPTTPPRVINFLLRPHHFPLSTYVAPWSFRHHNDLANLTLLRDELFFYDTRVRKNGGETKREFDKAMRRVVRVPKWKGWLKGDDVNGEKEKEEMGSRLLGGVKVGRVGGWVGDVILGGDGQRVEFALDMLSSDFVVYSTSTDGAFQKDVSGTYISMNTHISSICVLSSDHLTLPHDPSSLARPFSLLKSGTEFTTSRVPFTHCIAHRATLATLLPSGAVWGLAFPSLSQSTQSSLLTHLHTSPPLFQEGSAGLLERQIWSFATVSPTEAILTLGGTVIDFAPEKEWKWTELRDQVEGYWEVNMQSVLVEGVRVLRTIPRVVIDVSSALIIGPGEMVEVIWSFVEGARRLWELEPEWNGGGIMPEEEKFREWWGESDGEMGEWWVYPCLNEPLIQLEFAGWGFPVEKIGLGKVRGESGYCVGSIVGWPRHKREKGTEAGECGVTDEQRVWILGGPFWSGLVGVFDSGKRRVGMRTP